MEPKAGRARALNREERRAMIIEATIPLLVTVGEAVNSAQIAKAAGVAVGTVYSVFADKDELIRSCVFRHFDPQRAVRPFAALRGRASLDALVEGIIEATQERASETFALIALLDGRLGEQDRGRRPDEQALAEMCTELLVPFAGELRVQPARAAQAIRSAAFALSNPLLAGGDVLSVHEIRDLVLCGVVHGATSAVSATAQEA